MRLFKMVRDVDVTGIGGTGVVATGVEFDDGFVVIRWQGERPSTVIWASLRDAEAIHGHEGKTRFVNLAFVHVEGPEQKPSAS